MAKNPKNKPIAKGGKGRKAVTRDKALSRRSENRKTVLMRAKRASS